MRVRFAKPWAASILAGVFSYFAFAFCVASLDAWRVAQHNRTGLDTLLNDAMAGGIAASVGGLLLGVGLLALLASVFGARLMLSLSEQVNAGSFLLFLVWGTGLGLALGGGLTLWIGEPPLGAYLVAAACVGGLSGLILRATAGSKRGERPSSVAPQADGEPE